MALQRLLSDCGFTQIRRGRLNLYLAAELASEATAFGERLRALDVPVSEDAMGNRRGAVALEIDGLPPMVVRRNRRGGLIRFVVSDLYFGFAPRPVFELAVTAQARRRGIAVAQPMGAAVSWVLPGVYRGFFVTRAVAGETLWNFLKREHDPGARHRVLIEVRDTIAHAQAQGLYHADLNLHNFLLAQHDKAGAVTLIDLDKARLFPPPLPRRLVESNRRRLIASARKLAPPAALSADELAILTGLR